MLDEIINKVTELSSGLAELEEQLKGLQRNLDDYMRVTNNIFGGKPVEKPKQDTIKKTKKRNYYGGRR